MDTVSTTIELGYRPQLSASEVMRVLSSAFGDRYEVYEAGRLSVPDVMVKDCDRDGAAVQIIHKRLRKRTILKVYGLAPSLAQRAFSPVGLIRQASRTKPLVDEVAEVLKTSELGTLTA